MVLAMWVFGMDSKPDPERMRGDEVMAGRLDGNDDEMRGRSNDSDLDNVSIMIPAVNTAFIDARCPVVATLQSTDVKSLFQFVASHEVDPAFPEGVACLSPRCFNHASCTHL